MRDEAALLSALQDFLDVGRIVIDQAVFIVLVVITVAIAGDVLLLGGCCQSNLSCEDPDCACRELSQNNTCLLAFADCSCCLVHAVPQDRSVLNELKTPVPYT